MRAVVTGQVGLDKKSYLQSVARIAGERGDRVELFNVGDLMYGEAPDVRPGRILDLPLSRLASLRRAAFKDIIGSTSPAEDHPNVIVNTHATFRWRHGLFAAFDFDPGGHHRDRAAHGDAPRDAQGVSQLPHESCHGHARGARRDRPLPRRAGQALHHLRSG
ncbi:MAG: hypothetical protein LW625_06370 [Planctomycetaceae bacterium]|nr:hypothetical protein [Planctomycetaceae bacterium]